MQPKTVGKIGLTLIVVGVFGGLFAAMPPDTWWAGLLVMAVIFGGLAICILGKVFEGAMWTNKWPWSK